MKKVLFTTPILEHPPAGGPYLRIENSIKALNKICQLHLLSRLPQKFIGGQAAEIFFTKHSFRFIYSPSAHQETFFSKIVRRANKIVFGKNKQSDLMLDAQFIVDYVHKNKIDVVWFGYGNISHDLMVLVKKIDPKIKIVCDTDSVWSRYISRKLPYEKDPQKQQEIMVECNKKEAEEKAWVDFCDVVIAVSEIDAQYYRSLGDKPYKIKVFSNVIDVGNYSNLDHLTNAQGLKDVFLGGFFENGSPMDLASRWFINEVWPAVRQDVPDANLVIVGRNSDRVLSDINIDGITIKGKVDSVLPYLCKSGVSVVPLFFESGTRFKILEAGACKVPIVSTTLGAEGLAAVDGKHLLIADDAASFAESVVKLIKDGSYATNIKNNCFDLIKSEYGLQKLEHEGCEILQYLETK